MKFTHLKRAKARGLGTEKSGALLWVHFCMDRGCGWLGVEAKPWPFRTASPTATGDPPPRRCRAHHRTRDHKSSPWSWAGCRLSVPGPSHCRSQKRGLGCSRFWTPAGSPSHQAKRSLNIPVPPRIQIYTVPERTKGREGDEETGER